MGLGTKVFFTGCLMSIGSIGGLAYTALTPPPKVAEVRAIQKELSRPVQLWELYSDATKKRVEELETKIGVLYYNEEYRAQEKMYFERLDFLMGKGNLVGLGVMLLGAGIGYAGMKRDEKKKYLASNQTTTSS